MAPPPSNCPDRPRAWKTEFHEAFPEDATNSSESRWDYIIVGSGAGGGPLAARLALAGRRVLLLEAGGPDKDDSAPHSRLTEQVPGYHAASTEDPEISWEMWCRHNKDHAIDREDSKFDHAHQGVFYPRASCLGGCTAHNAMVTIYGHDSDWQDIVDRTGDTSWSPEIMRRYFERLENCRYRGRWPEGWKKSHLLELARRIVRWLLPDRMPNMGRHGFDGWLYTTLYNPELALKDTERQLLRVILTAVHAAVEREGGDPGKLLKAVINDGLVSSLDPNDATTLQRMSGPRHAAASDQQRMHPRGGAVLIPLSVHDGVRSGPREFLLETAKHHCPGNLCIRTGALVTRLIFDRHTIESGSPRVIGVEVRRGRNLYRAGLANCDGAPGETKKTELYVREGGEVILCGGTFNTPQLLMLSGIGPADELNRIDARRAKQTPPEDPPEPPRPRIVNENVGSWLQDRYEISVISRKHSDWEALGSAAFNPDDKAHDKAFEEWRSTRSGIYAGNGGLIGLITRSSDAVPEPDLFIFALPAFFAGYYRGWSNDIVRRRDMLTWVILKAHSKRGAEQREKHGRVTLNAEKPEDPLSPPVIQFNSFPDGDTDADLTALVEGVRLVRGINKRLTGFTPEETDNAGRTGPPRSGPHCNRIIAPQPGPDVDLRSWIRREAWGHHACGTCRISKDARTGVVDSSFRVHGVDGLRIVDASIFPRIPGMFIVTPLYMVSEKAADTILATPLQPLPGNV